jgi:hypothetical protein
LTQPTDKLTPRKSLKSTVVTNEDIACLLQAKPKDLNFEEGKIFGRAQGLTEGIKEGAQLAASEVASLSKRLSDSLKQSNGIATENLIVIQTAAGLAVELQRERNLVAVQTVKLAKMKRTTKSRRVSWLYFEVLVTLFCAYQGPPSQRAPAAHLILESH